MKIKLLLKLSFVILIFNSCHEMVCLEKELPSVKFTPSDFQIVPYDGKETLVFKSLNARSITYYGNNRNYETRIVTENPQEYSYSGCKGTYYETNGSIVFFQAAEGFDRFSINMYFTNSFDSGFSKKLIQFGLEFNGDSIRTFGGEYYFSEDTLFSGKPKYGVATSIKGYYKTIQFGQNYYNNVYEFNGDYESGDKQSEWISSLYYNFSNGIVGFSTNKGKSWYLE